MPRSESIPTERIAKLGDMAMPLRSGSFLQQEVLYVMENFVNVGGIQRTIFACGYTERYVASLPIRDPRSADSVLFILHQILVGGSQTGTFSQTVSFLGAYSYNDPGSHGPSMDLPHVCDISSSGTSHFRDYQNHFRSPSLIFTLLISHIRLLGILHPMRWLPASPC